MAGRDLPRRGRLELHRREPRLLPRDLDPAVAELLAAAPPSARDRAIVTLLLRTGQRIGDWSDEHGRHGVLGMRLADVDHRRRAITVRLKGARDEHRVPVTPDWWPLLDEYLNTERGQANTPALWTGRRQGKDRPLRYAAFETSFRRTTARLGVHATAHMFRHTVAQQLVDTAGLKVAQEILGHRHVSTTAEEYAYADEKAMLAALTEVACEACAERWPMSTSPRGSSREPMHSRKFRMWSSSMLPAAWTTAAGGGGPGGPGAEDGVGGGGTSENSYRPRVIHRRPCVPQNSIPLPVRPGASVASKVAVNCDGIFQQDVDGVGRGPPVLVVVDAARRRRRDRIVLPMNMWTTSIQCVNRSVICPPPKSRYARKLKYCCGS